MSTPERELLRPEDATSLEEFQARRSVEQANLLALNSSWKRIGQILLSSVLGFCAIFFWLGVATIHDVARWVFLALALAFSLLVVWVFGRIERRGYRGSKRYMQLTKLSKEWQARAERGEIPPTTPGGPAVFRDQLEARQR